MCSSVARGSDTKDTQGVNTDAAVQDVLDAAAAGGVSIAWHLEPYHERNATSVRADIEYLTRRYGEHPALLSVGGCPVYYVYDSYATPPVQWRDLLCRDQKSES